MADDHHPGAALARFLQREPGERVTAFQKSDGLLIHIEVYRAVRAEPVGPCGTYQRPLQTRGPA